MTEKKKRNWKTTLCAVGKVLAIVGTAIAAACDADPETAAGWGASAFAVFEIAQGWWTRDKDVTSEGAKVSA